MSELIEINEDNCVLDDGEIDLMDIAFGDFMLDIKSKSEKDEIHNQFKKIFLKINKLNEMAKELREMEDEAPTAYRLLYKEKQK